LSNYGWGVGFGWIFMIFLWALVIFGIMYVVKAISRKTDRQGIDETPLDLLKKRYAQGEITKEEFERIKDDLMKQ